MNEATITVLLKLVLAHLLCDFLLQPKKWIEHKEKHHIGSRYQYFHALLHGVLLYIFVAQWQQWWIIPVISISHLVIDIIKSFLRTPKVLWFLADQLAHLSVIIIVWSSLTDTDLSFLVNLWDNKTILLGITAYFTVTLPFSFLISQAIESWREKLPDETDDSLQNAGKWIGMIERMLVLSFVLASQYEAIGFLLAAKSVFRFGDLKGHKDKSLTEYVLIGTLLSFGITILLGMCINRLIIMLT